MAVRHRHLTIARLRSAPEDKVAHFLAGNAFFSSQSFEVRHFRLYSSLLTEGRAIHTLEALYPF